MFKKCYLDQKCCPCKKKGVGSNIKMKFLQNYICNALPNVNLISFFQTPI